jgi:transcriptional regulator with XRE-family HTH domain
MSKKLEPLSEYVDRKMKEKNLSTYAVERMSGGEISQSQVSRIRNGGSKNPSAETLKALAKGLGVVEGELFAVIRGKNLSPVDFVHEKLTQIDVTYRNLSIAKKERADYLIELIEREMRYLMSQ